MVEHPKNCDCADCVHKLAFNLSAKTGIPIQLATEKVKLEIAEARELEETQMEESKIREQIREQKESEEIRETLKKASKKVHFAKEKLKAVEQLEFELKQSKERMLDIESRFKTLIRQRILAESYLVEERKRFEVEIAKLNRELKESYNAYAKLQHEKTSDYWLEWKKFEAYYERKLKHVEKQFKEQLAWQDYVIRQLRENP